MVVIHPSIQLSIYPYNGIQVYLRLAIVALYIYIYLRAIPSIPLDMAIIAFYTYTYWTSMSIMPCYLSICQSINLSIYLSIYLSNGYLSIYLSIYLSNGYISKSGHTQITEPWKSHGQRGLAVQASLGGIVSEIPMISGFFGKITRKMSTWWWTTHVHRLGGLVHPVMFVGLCLHKNPIEITRVGSPTTTMNVGSSPPSVELGWTVGWKMGYEWDMKLDKKKGHVFLERWESHMGFFTGFDTRWCPIVS